jgi:hypothetical protein
MDQIKIEPQEFQGTLGKIPAYLTTSTANSSKLAVVLPGAGYSFRQPLLHFATQVLLQKGFRVLALDKIYGEDPKWTSLKSEQEARKIVEDDSVAVFKEVKSRFGGEPHTVLGRSLGTYAIACGLEHEVLRPQQIVWQTPALGSKWSVMRQCGIRGFGIIGTADFYFKDAITNLPDDRIVIENADHGMEVSDPIESIKILQKVTEATSNWISGL